MISASLYARTQCCHCPFDPVRKKASADIARLPKQRHGRNRRTGREKILMLRSRNEEQSTPRMQWHKEGREWVRLGKTTNAVSNTYCSGAALISYPRSRTKRGCFPRRVFLRPGRWRCEGSLTSPHMQKRTHVVHGFLVPLGLRSIRVFMTQPVTRFVCTPLPKISLGFS